MAEYAFVVCASDDYVPGVKAFLASAKEHASYADIVFGSWRFPRELLGGCIVHDMPGDCRVKGTAQERFRLCCDVIYKYKSICLLDADMFLLSDPRLFFEIAEAGFVVTGHNGMIVNFDEGYQKKYDIDLGVKSWPYTKTHTSVPVFLNIQNIDWLRAIYDMRNARNWDDFLYLNILGIKMGKYSKMLCMPAYTFTGIHHWQIKPETAVMSKAGRILSGTEEDVYMCHGKWWDSGWRSDLEKTMEKYFGYEQTGMVGRGHTKRAIELLYDKFKTYSNT